MHGQLSIATKMKQEAVHHVRTVVYEDEGSSSCTDSCHKNIFFLYSMEARKFIFNEDTVPYILCGRATTSDKMYGGRRSPYTALSDVVALQICFVSWARPRRHPKRLR